jgi:pimeloyl-ACP methyl ester carboxylesterase
MVDVAGRKLHLIRKGHGGPTVVIESGAGSGSFMWWPIQDRLAEITTVCTYDRAGLGWSEQAHSSRSLIQRATELHELLVSAKVPAPYVLVGYSYGGLLIRPFIRDHPEAVAGAVFVDAGHEAVYSREEVRRTNLSGMAGMFRLLGRLATLGLLRLFNVRLMSPPADGLTDLQRKVLATRFPTSRSFRYRG